jgi:hypothetical protein
MKTFREYAAARGWFEETGAQDPLITQAIAQLGLGNDKIVAGATTQKDAARAMNTPQVKNVMKKEGPQAAGKISAALTDPKATGIAGV